MSVEAQGARRRTETVNVPGQLPLIVVVRDDAGNPVSDVSVTFGALPLGSVVFPGERQTVTVRTNAQGEAATDYTPRDRGQHEVVASTTNHGRTTFTLDTYPAESPVEMHQLGGTDLAVLRTPPPVIVPPERDRSRGILALALSILGLLTIGGLIALFAMLLDRSPITVEKPMLVTQEKIVPPVDNQARGEVAAERKRNDDQDHRLGEHEEVQWAIGGAAQAALANDDKLLRNFEEFVNRGGTQRSGGGTSGGAGDVCSGPSWFRYQRCINARR